MYLFVCRFNVDFMWLVKTNLFINVIYYKPLWAHILFCIPEHWCKLNLFLPYLFYLDLNMVSKAKFKHFNKMFWKTLFNECHRMFVSVHWWSRFLHSRCIWIEKALCYHICVGTLVKQVSRLCRKPFSLWFCQLLT